MREVNGQDLLGGSDHEFVVNLYTVLLNRWPDEDGYRHHLQRVENRPETRRQLVDEVAGSPEGRNLGVAVMWPEDVTPAEAAPQTPATTLPFSTRYSFLKSFIKRGLLFRGVFPLSLWIAYHRKVKGVLFIILKMY